MSNLLSVLRNLIIVICLAHSSFAQSQIHTQFVKKREKKENAWSPWGLSYTADISKNTVSIARAEKTAIPTYLVSSNLLGSKEITFELDAQKKQAFDINLPNQTVYVSKHNKQIAIVAINITLEQLVDSPNLFYRKKGTRLVFINSTKHISLSSTTPDINDRVFKVTKIASRAWSSNTDGTKQEKKWSNWVVEEKPLQNDDIIITKTRNSTQETTPPFEMTVDKQKLVLEIDNEKTKELHANAQNNITCYKIVGQPKGYYVYVINSTLDKLTAIALGISQVAYPENVSIIVDFQNNSRYQKRYSITPQI